MWKYYAKLNLGIYKSFLYSTELMIDVFKHEDLENRATINQVPMSADHLSITSIFHQKDEHDGVLELETRGVDFKGNIRYFCPKCNVRYIGKFQKLLPNFLLIFSYLKQSLNTWKPISKNVETSTSAKCASKSSSRSELSLHTWRRNMESLLCLTSQTACIHLQINLFSSSFKALKRFENQNSKPCIRLERTPIKLSRVLRQ